MKALSFRLEKPKIVHYSTRSYYILKENYLPSKNPIVLCHGLYGYDKIAFENFPYLQINYWQGIADALNKLGNKVIIAKVPRTGSIAERTRQLNALLERTVANQEVNIIGHSMGGLDGRYLISKIKNKKYKVNSLITISTPHHGSQFMDWCHETLKLGRIKSEQYKLPKQAEFWDKIMYKLDAPAYHHLTTNYCDNVFNPNTPNDSKVQYYSVNSYIEKMNQLNLLYFPWSIIQQRAGKNDGIVALSSAIWGQLIHTVQASHFELVSRYRWIYAILSNFGFQDPRYIKNPKLPLPQQLFLNPNPNLDTIDFYCNLATFLRSKGL